MSATTAAWDTMGTDDAARLAVETGRTVVWAEDGTLGFARPLRDGETVAEALADFDAPYLRDGHHGHEGHEVYDAAGDRIA